MKLIFSYFRNKIKRVINFFKWKSINKHNNTSVKTLCPLNKITVGKCTYGILEVISYNEENEGLQIGNYCSFAGSTLFILGGEHRYKGLSTFPFENMLTGNSESFSKGPIIIDDDVWVGYNVTILSGTHIGQGAIIGAGTTVSGEIPPYSIYTNKGIVKYRFSDKIIEKLLKFDFSKFNPYNCDVEKLIEEITEKNVDSILLSLDGKKK